MGSPTGDARRLRALRSYRIVGGGPDSELDQLCTLVRGLVDAPAAAITLVDEEREWFQARSGTVFPAMVPLSDSICREVLDTGAPLIVPDLAGEPRFSELARSGVLPFRAYLGVPLIDVDGFVLGSVCAGDVQPRAFNPHHVERMQLIARHVARLLDDRRRIARLLEVVSSASEYLFVVSPEAVITHATPNTVRAVGGGALSISGWTLDQLPLAAELRDRIRDRIQTVAEKRAALSLPITLLVDGRRQDFMCRFVPRFDIDGSVAEIVISVRDVTELRQVEQTLAERTELFRAIAESTSDAVYTKDLQGRYTFINAAGARALGRDVTEILEHQDAELMSASETASTLVRDRQVISEERTINYEDPQERDGKRVVWLSTKGPLRDTSGKVIGLFGISRDITSRKRLEDAYRIAAERLRLAHEAAQLGSWDWTLSNGEIFWSAPPLPGETAAKTQVLKSGVASAFLEQVHPEDRPWVRDELIELVKNPRPYSFEYRVIGLDGEVRWQRSWGTSLNTDHGAVRMVGVVSDVTDRRRIEEERSRLLVSEQAARREADRARAQLALLDTISSELIAAPLDETVRLQLLADLVIPALGRVAVLVEAADESRRSEQRLQMVAPEDSFPEGVPDSLVAMCEQALSSGPGALVVSALGVTEAATSVLLVPIRTQSHRFGTLAVLSDASPDELESARMLAQEVGYRASLALENARLFHQEENAVHERDEVVAIVSHDLKNPLMAIQLLSDRVARLAGPGRDGELLRRTSEQIRVHVKKMEQLVADFLDISVMEAGKLHLSMEPHAAGSLVTEALQAVAPLARARKITLKAKVSPGVGAVECDRERLLQVFSNILGNALKFTPGGGEIETSADLHQGNVRFSVRDTGPGMTPEVLSRIFDRFYQSRKSRRADVGLGLAIAKGIVEAHGGKLWAESKPGQGAAFHFTVPRSAAQVEWSDAEVMVAEEPTRPPEAP